MSVIHAPKAPTFDLRTLLFPIAIAIGLVVVFFRLWYLQVVRGAELSIRADNFRTSKVIKPAPRGLIFDRNNVLLAGVRSHFVVTAKPAEMKKNPWVLEKLASMLKVEPARLTARLEDAKSKPYLPAAVYADLPVETAVKIAESLDSLPGIDIDWTPMRMYPDSQSFSNILGYVWVPNKEDLDRLDGMGLKSPPFVGKNGLEYVYEPKLMGEPGFDNMEVDNKRRPVRLAERDNPTVGDVLRLGIDSNLQKVALEGLKGKVGAVVALDTQTGEVLSMVSTPTFDAKLFEHGISSADWKSLTGNKDKPLINRATSASYPPGSTFKIVVSLAALEAGTLDPNRAVFCPGYYLVGKHRTKCLSQHGSITYETAFEKSCNTYFCDLAVRTGKELLLKKSLEVGLNEKTGVDLRAESRGLIPTEAWINKHRDPPKWYLGDTVNFGIGQGDLRATPIQMANLACLVANRGTNYKPHLVHSIQGPNDKEPVVIAPEVAHHIQAPDSFWDLLQGAMVRVINSGTGQKGKIQGLTWAGKTGSSERHGHTLTDSWFVGYAPADKPRIAIAVIVEDAGHGGDIAAPIGAAVVKRYLMAPGHPQQP